MLFGKNYEKPLNIFKENFFNEIFYFFIFFFLSFLTCASTFILKKYIPYGNFIQPIVTYILLIPWIFGYINHLMCFYYKGEYSLLDLFYFYKIDNFLQLIGLSIFLLFLTILCSVFIVSPLSLLYFKQAINVSVDLLSLMFFLSILFSIFGLIFTLLISINYSLIFIVKIDNEFINNPFELMKLSKNIIKQDKSSYVSVVLQPLFYYVLFFFISLLAIFFVSQVAGFMFFLGIILFFILIPLMLYGMIDFYYEYKDFESAYY